MEHVNWEIELENPSIYPAFKWREIHMIAMPKVYLEIVVRETEGDKFAPFEVTVGAASGYYSNITPEMWKTNGGPWRNHFGDCFYGSEKYKEEFDCGIYPEPKNLHSVLRAGFDSLEEAKNFAEQWKMRLWEDHKQYAEETVK